MTLTVKTRSRLSRPLGYRESLEGVYEVTVCIKSVKRLTTMSANQQDVQSVSHSTTKSELGTCLEQEVRKSFHLCLPETLHRDLVNCVRSEANINYMKSKTVVGVVLSELRDRIPSISNIMDGILAQKETFQSSSDLSHCEDAIVLKQHFEEVATCRNSSNQCASLLDENEVKVKAHLEGLLDILDNADSEICRKVVEEDDYMAVHTLVLYYQMEVRVQLRLVMLQIFGALCGLDAKVVSELKDSVLPVELARDMKSDTTCSRTFMYSCLVLTMLFSTGEPLPVGHYDHLNEEFLRFLFDLVEDPPADDVVDELPDRVIPVILAFNLHIQVPDENPVFTVLSQQATANRFLEELMMLVNREVDPVRILPHEPHPSNSFMKFLSDMYSRQDTSKLFYTNDEKVLIDILLRHIQNCTPENSQFTECLSVFHLMLRNSCYQDHCHHLKDFQQVFTNIYLEDDNENTIKDKLIVKQIWKEFPHLFSE